MKFHQLAIGTRFHYRGQDYCKSSPLAASAGDGSQRMIPRSAKVTLLDDTPQTTAADGRQPLHAAIQRHHERCRELLSQAAVQLPEPSRLELLGALEDSYRALLENLPGDR
jgi:hypothetical protein